MLKISLLDISGRNHLWRPLTSSSPWLSQWVPDFP